MNLNSIIEKLESKEVSGDLKKKLIDLDNVYTAYYSYLELKKDGLINIYCDKIEKSEHISSEVKKSLFNKIKKLALTTELLSLGVGLSSLETQLSNLVEAIEWRSQADHPKCIICGKGASVSMYNTYLCSYHHGKYMGAELRLPDFYDLLTYVRDCNLLERDRAILKQYSLGESLADIAKKENLSRQSISNTLNKIPWYYPRVRMSKTTKSINPKHKICLAEEKDYPLYDLCPYCYGKGGSDTHEKKCFILAKDGSVKVYNNPTHKFSDYHYVKCRDCHKSWLVLYDD